MRTIRFERLDPEMPLPDGNPITLRCAERERHMVHGDVVAVHTGMRIYLPKEALVVVESRVPGAVALWHGQGEVQGDMVVGMICCDRAARVTRMQELATVRVLDAPCIPVRFVEMSKAGTRLVAGDAAPAVPGHNEKD